MVVEKLVDDMHSKVVRGRDGSTSEVVLMRLHDDDDCNNALV